MALDVSAVESHGSGHAAPSHGGKAASHGASAPAEGGITFKRNFFINQEGTGVRNNDRGVREGGVHPEKVTFNAELKTQYKTFLDNYIQRLSNFRNRYPDRFDSVLRNPQHSYDKMLFSLMSKNLTDHETGVQGSFESNEAAIEKFLQSPTGWEATTQLLEHQTILQMYALGVHASNISEGTRQQMADQMTIRLGKENGQGMLNRLWFNQIEPRLTNKVKAGLTGFVASSGLGFVLGNVPGMAVGAGASAAAMGGAEMFMRGIRNGDMIQIQQCKGAFEAIANNPAEAEYVKYVMNIDVTDFVATGPNRIRLSGGISETGRVAELQDQLLQNLHSRREFYKALKIPEERLDALPEQFLYRYTSGQQEQTGTWMQQRIQELFSPNEGGILDTSGRTPLDAGFDENNLAYEGNLTRYMDARRKALLEMLGSHLRAEKMRHAAGEGGIDVLRKKLEARKTSFAKDITDQKDALEKQKEPLVAQQEKLAKLGEVANPMKKAQERYETELGDYHSRGLTIDAAKTAIEADITTEKATLKRIEDDELNQKAVMVTTELGRHTRPGTGSTKAELDQWNALVKQVTASVDVAYERKMQRIKDRITELRTELTTVKDIQREGREASGGIKDVENNVLQSAKEDLGQMTGEFAAFTGWGMTEDFLREPSTTVDQVLQAVNARHAATGGAEGWPPSENTTAENRRRVTQAMTEARAVYQERLDTPRRSRYPSFEMLATGYGGRIGGWNVLSENGLRTLSRSQIMQEITDRGLPVWMGMSDADRITMVDQAVAEARNRMLIRNKIHTQIQLEDINARMDTAVKRAEAVDKEVASSPDIVTLQMTIDMLSKQGPILEKASEMDLEAEEYFENISIRGNANYSVAEQAADLPKGYYDIMNMLFEYRNKPDRDEQLKKIQQVLPPQKLADFLNAELQLSLGAGRPLADILRGIHTDTPSYLGGRDFSIVFRSLLLRMQREANAL